MFINCFTGLSVTSEIPAIVPNYRIFKTNEIIWEKSRFNDNDRVSDHSRLVNQVKVILNLSCFLSKGTTLTSMLEIFEDYTFSPSYSVNHGMTI